MIEKIIVRKSAAVLSLLPSGRVRKTFTQADGPYRLSKDRHNLVVIQQKFGTVQREGWTYSFVKLLGTNHQPPAIEMEFVPGVSVPNLPKTLIPEAERRCGEWLAHYHEKLLNGLEGLIYKDCGPGNFIIDFEKKRVTGIDPGITWGEKGFTYEDILLHVHCIIQSLMLKHRKARPSDTLAFLNGYMSVRKIRFVPCAYYRSYYRSVMHTFRCLGKTSKPKLLASIVVMTALVPLYVIVIPAKLCLSTTTPLAADNLHNRVSL